MKTKNDFKELTKEEMIIIQGGDKFTYDLGYSIGLIWKGISSFASGYGGYSYAKTGIK